MDAPGVGLGQNDGFVYQARAFLEEVAGIDEAESLPRCASFSEGVHNMEVLAAVAESAANGGAAIVCRSSAKLFAQKLFSRKLFESGAVQAEVAQLEEVSR